MKLKLFIVFLLSMLALTACQMTAPSQEPIPPAAPPDLYIPRDVRFAYGLGTRSADGNPGPQYWQNHAVHDITLTVAPPSRTISATQSITYTNNSPYSLPGLVLKLLGNVHRPEAMRDHVFGEGFLNDGWQIDELRVNGEAQPWAPDDRFVGIQAIPLPTPLAPNAAVNLSIRWHYALADHLEHTKEGAVDETTFFLAYFFPRVAVLDDVNPDLWDQAEFTYGSQEQYNDFADFTVTVNAPKNFIVWATGDLQNPDEVLQPAYAERLAASLTSDDVINIAQPDAIQQGLVTAQSDTVTWKWQADNVPDFVVALSDHYIWDAGSVVVDPASGRRACRRPMTHQPPISNRWSSLARAHWPLALPNGLACPIPIARPPSSAVSLTKSIPCLPTTVPMATQPIPVLSRPMSCCTVGSPFTWVSMSNAMALWMKVGQLLLNT